MERSASAGRNTAGWLLPGWPQQPELSALAHAAGFAPGVIAKTPEEVGTLRSADCTTGVLRQYQPFKWAARVREGCHQPHWRAQRHEGRVYRDGPPGNQGHAKGAGRSGVPAP